VGANVAILAGEASGDAYGALLALELQRRVPGLCIWGIGGARMRAAGVELLESAEGWAAIGVVESLRIVPRLRFRVLPKLQRSVLNRRPSLVIPIDFGAFNVPVCRWCKRRGRRVLYYLPPGSWRRDGRLPYALAQATDLIATQFAWSVERLRSVGAHAEFVGHPLLDLISSEPAHPGFHAELGFPEGCELIALLPGSRVGELVHNSPAMSDAALIARERRPQLRYVVALAAGAPRRVVDRAMRGLLSQRDTDGRAVACVVEGRTRDALKHAAAGLVCSGTATLEAAILGMPMVIVYRGSRLMYLEYALRRLSRIEHIGLPNIIAGRRIVPEFVAREATPQALSGALCGLLEDPATVQATQEALAEVCATLGEPGATARVAELAMAMMGDRGRSDGEA